MNRQDRNFLNDINVPTVIIMSVLTDTGEDINLSVSFAPCSSELNYTVKININGIPYDSHDCGVCLWSVILYTSRYTTKARTHVL